MFHASILLLLSRILLLLVEMLILFSPSFTPQHTRSALSYLWSCEPIDKEISSFCRNANRSWFHNWVHGFSDEFMKSKKRKKKPNLYVLVQLVCRWCLRYIRWQLSYTSLCIPSWRHRRGQSRCELQRFGHQRTLASNGQRDLDGESIKSIALRGISLRLLLNFQNRRDYKYSKNQIISDDIVFPRTVILNFKSLLSHEPFITYSQQQIWYA